MQYRKDIQGMRALAVFCVFIFHLNPKWLPGGFIGVDIFFVLSGFLVSSIILAEQQKGTFSVKRFYFKRIKRIVPAYYVMLACTAVAAATILIGIDVEAFKGELLHAAIFDSDRVYATMIPHFGAPLRQHPLLHTWTLGTEMKFYLLLPLLLFVPFKKYRFSIIIAITVCLLAFGIYQTEIMHNGGWGYYALAVRVPEFCAGVLLALRYDELTEKFKYIKSFSGYLGLFLLCLSAIFFTGVHFPGMLILIPCIGAVLLLLYETSPANVLLSKKPLVYLGTISYSVYLWHNPVINLMRYYNAGSAFSIGQYILIFTLTALLSVLSYVFVEDVLRKKKPRAFWFAMAPVVVSVCGLYFFTVPLSRVFSTIPPEYAGPVFGMKSHNASYVETFGETTKTPGILLIGNSHALSLKAYLDYIGRENNFSFRTVTTNSYLAIEGIDAEEVKKNGRFGDFTDAQRLVSVTQKEIKNSKVVILVSNSYTIVPSLIPAIENLVLHLDKSQHLIIVGTFPILNKNPLQVNRDYLKNKDITQKYKLRYKPQNEKIMHLVNEYPNVHYFDLSESRVYKDAPFYKDTLMYYDRKHLNSFGATVLAKDTQSRFMKLLDSIQ